MEPLENILLTTKRLDLDEARREIRKIVRTTGMSADKVLAGLDEDRQALFAELYDREIKDSRSG